MKSNPLHPVRAKLICVIIAIGLWWLIKTYTEPNFWYKEWQLFSLRQGNER